jgi:hypothetical protein
MLVTQRESAVARGPFPAAVNGGNLAPKAFGYMSALVAHRDYVLARRLLVSLLRFGRRPRKLSVGAYALLMETHMTSTAALDIEKRRKFLTSTIAAAAIPAAALVASKAFGQVGSTPPVLGSYFNVKSYGAAGTGSDDTGAINSAIAAAASAGGGIVIFPAGTYVVAGSISLTSGVHLQGVGADSSILSVPSNSASDTISISGVNSSGIFDLGIVSSSARTSGKAIFIQQTQNVVIERVIMSN